MAAMAAALAGLVGLVLVAVPAAAHETSTTVVHRVAGAPSIGLLGDSTLAGVRWYGEYGDLERFSYVLDAESCRRTVETSCWSREGYRPETGLQALERLSGRWGDVLVAMLGYNDSGGGFGWSVRTLLDEARRQGVGRVVWLTLRVADVRYEEPLHQANGLTYRTANRTLLDIAGQSGGFLQVADWASYSTGRDDWFETDGVHLSREGAGALTSFVAAQVEEVLAGRTVTPAAPPWFSLAEGDRGPEVVAVQEALLARGRPLPGGADGVYGEATTAAVLAFQSHEGLPATGVADLATARALGLREASGGEGRGDAAATAGAAPGAGLAPGGAATPPAGAARPFPVTAQAPPRQSLSWLPLVAIPGLLLAVAALAWPGRPPSPAQPARPRHPPSPARPARPRPRIEPSDEQRRERRPRGEPD